VKAEKYMSGEKQESPCADQGCFRTGLWAQHLDPQADSAGAAV